MEPYPRFCKKEPEKWSFFIFLAVCLKGKMHFCSIFLKFPSQGVHSNHFSCHFSFHFSFPFVCFSAKYTKMSRKWVWKWAENGPRMATVNNPIDFITNHYKLVYWLHYKPVQSCLFTPITNLFTDFYKLVYWLPSQTCLLTSLQTTNSVSFLLVNLTALTDVMSTRAQ